MHKTLDEALAALETAITDVSNDIGEEASDDNVYDLVVSVAYDCTREVARELCRTQLGFLPDSVR